jgi:hypothetical protein
MSIRDTPKTKEKNPLTLISNSEESTTREMKAPIKAPMTPDSTASMRGFLMQPMSIRQQQCFFSATCFNLRRTWLLKPKHFRHAALLLATHTNDDKASSGVRSSRTHHQQ